MREAIAVLEEAIAVDRREGLGDDWRCFAKLSMVARAHLKIGHVEAGLATYDTLKVVNPTARSIGDTRWRHFYAIQLARLGRVEDALVQVEESQPMVRELDASFMGGVHCTRAFVHLIGGDVDSARRWARRTIESGDIAITEARLCLALCDLASGNPRAAITELEFQRAFAAQERMLKPEWAAEVRYHLARAYESIGESEKAAHRYREFLDTWRDADPEIQLIVRDRRDPDDRPLEFARRRLEALESGI
jgi:tetratricopeptide (TPR) repeat protein